MRRRVYNPRLMTTNNITIGLDLGDRRHAVCVLSASGQILAEEAIPNTRECLMAFSPRYPGATFVMETGTHSPWVSRLLQVPIAGVMSELSTRRRGGPGFSCRAFSPNVARPQRYHRHAPCLLVQVAPNLLRVQA
jgi:hypothetical protein